MGRQEGVPFEAQGTFGGEALNGCVFDKVPSLLREPLRTVPSFFSRLADADPRQIRPTGRQARVLYWGCIHCQGGLDDQMWVFYNLLSLATALHAALAIYPPTLLLTKAHGRPE